MNIDHNAFILISYQIHILQSCEIFHIVSMNVITKFEGQRWKFTNINQIFSSINNN